MTSQTTVREQLYVKYGDRRYPVSSLEDASRKWNQFRNTTGAGASELGGKATIETEAGTPVGRISYNGRIWAPSAGDFRSENKAKLLCESVY